MKDIGRHADRLGGVVSPEDVGAGDALTPEVLHSYDSILSVHNLTRDAVERSLDYYTRHLDEYQTIHEEVVTRLEAERDGQ